MMPDLVIAMKLGFLFWIACTIWTGGAFAAFSSEWEKEVMEAWSKEPGCVQGLAKLQSKSAFCAAGVAVINLQSESYTVDYHIIKANSSHGEAKPFNQRALYEIASNTKVLAAVLLQRLVDLNQLSMQDTVGQFLDCISDGRPVHSVTLYELATHTSGLPAVPNNLRKEINPYTKYSKDDLCSCLNNITKLPRRHKFTYSNLAFGLLGYLLGLSQNKTFETLLTENVLRPLDMDNTKVHLSETEWNGGTVPGVNLQTGESPVWRRQEYGILQANGALHSTLEDMSRFLAAALKAELGANEGILGSLRRTFKKVQWSCPCYTDHCEGEPCVGNQPTFLRGIGAMGWQSYTHLSRSGWVNAGDSEGYSSFMAMLSPSGRAAVGFDNCGGCGAEGLLGSAIQRAVKILVSGRPASLTCMNAKNSILELLAGTYNTLKSLAGLYLGSGPRKTLELSQNGFSPFSWQVKITSNGGSVVESSACLVEVDNRGLEHHAALFGLKLHSPVGSPGLGSSDNRPLATVDQNRIILWKEPSSTGASVPEVVLSDEGMNTYFVRSHCRWFGCIVSGR